jgi:hypothetical protein
MMQWVLYHFKIDMPKSNITIMWTPIFERYAVRCESKNRHQKDMFLKENRPCAQIKLTILGSTVNMIGGTI